MAVDSRLPELGRAPSAGARFRCDVCQRFVRSTEHGVCPGCGRSPLAWRAPAPARMAEGVPWTYVLGLAALLGALISLAW